MLTHLIVLDATSVDPVQWFINYGLAGIVVFLLITGQLRTKSEVAALQKVAEDRARAIAEARAEGAQKDAALQTLMLQITQSTLPTLTQTAKLVERIPVHKPSENELVLVRRLEALADRLEALEAGGDEDA